MRTVVLTFGVIAALLTGCVSETGPLEPDTEEECLPTCNDGVPVCVWGGFPNAAGGIVCGVPDCEAPMCTSPNGFVMCGDDRWASCR